MKYLRTLPVEKLSFSPSLEQTPNMLLSSKYLNLFIEFGFISGVIKFSKIVNKDLK